MSHTESQFRAKTGLRHLAYGLCAALSLSATTVWAESVVKIGILAPLSGGHASDGVEMLRGARLAVEEVNAQGGINGYTFEVVEGDVGDQRSDAVISAFERLSSDEDLHLIATGYASTTNFEIEYMAEIDMPYLIAGSSGQTRDIISPNPDKFPTVWSLTPSYDGYQTELVPVLSDLMDSGALEFDNNKVAFISSDNPYSMTIYEGLRKSFTEAGWDVSMEEVVPFGEINDWRAMLARVRQDPPAVLINTHPMPPDASTFMRQFMENPTDSLVFIQYAPSVPEFLELTKEQSTGVVYNLLGGVLDTPKNPRAQEVKKKFQDRWGVESGFYGIALYEMLQIYFKAVEEVGDPSNRLAIGEAIGNTRMATAQGFVAFDPATHLSIQDNAHVPIQFYQIWNGERILFYPIEFATGSFQRPPWME